MSWRILVLAVGMLLASSAAIGVFAGPGDTSSDGPPAVAGEPDDGTDDGDADDGTDDGDPDDVGTLQDGEGQRDVLGIPDDNTQPCDNVEGDCRLVENAGGKTLRLPAPAADAIEAACWTHDPDCHPNADNGDTSSEAHEDDDDGPHGPPSNVPRGPPHDVPRGGPHADDD